MPESRTPRPPAERFAPQRLRAAALREEIEATQAELEATVAALARGDEGVSAERVKPPEPVERLEQPEPMEGVDRPESAEDVGWDREPAPAVAERNIPSPIPPPPSSSPPIAAVALTFIAGVGAGLLLRRR